jgi:hypothetical protein
VGGVTYAVAVFSGALTYCLMQIRFNNLNTFCDKLICVCRMFVGAGNEIDNLHFSSKPI